ncbi:unnamed protein product [Chrysoparadoxa australica]
MVEVSSESPVGRRYSTSSHLRHMAGANPVQWGYQAVGPITRLRGEEEEVKQATQDGPNVEVAKPSPLARMPAAKVRVSFPIGDSGTWFKDRIDWNLGCTAMPTPQEFSLDLARKFGLSGDVMLAVEVSVEQQLQAHLIKHSAISMPYLPMAARGLTGASGKGKGKGGGTQFGRMLHHRRGPTDFQMLPDNPRKGHARPRGSKSQYMTKVSLDALSSRKRKVVEQLTKEFLPFAVEAHVKQNRSCHICHNPKPIVVNCCGIETHNMCGPHLKNRFNITVDEIRADPSLYKACPVCVLLCPCAACKRKLEKRAKQYGPDSGDEGESDEGHAPSEAGSTSKDAPAATQEAATSATKQAKAAPAKAKASGAKQSSGPSIEDQASPKTVNAKQGKGQLKSPKTPKTPKTKASGGKGSGSGIAGGKGKATGGGAKGADGKEKDKQGKGSVSKAKKKGEGKLGKSDTGAAAAQAGESTWNEDGNSILCSICLLGGEMLCCDSCPRAFHTACLKMKDNELPEGEWHCRFCREGIDHQTPTLKPVPAKAKITPILHAERILEWLWDHEFAAVFREEVNSRDIPDYDKVVKQKMDLSKIKRKLRDKVYKTKPAQFVSDVRLIFSNCLAYNTERSAIARGCTLLSVGFENLYDVVLKPLLSNKDVQALAKEAQQREEKGKKLKLSNEKLKLSSTAHPGQGKRKNADISDGGELSPKEPAAGVSSADTVVIPKKIPKKVRR